MSTWDDKPNDYDHAVAWALEERAKAARFAAALEEIAALGDVRSDEAAVIARRALNG
jgi:hypothetical protein